MPSDSNVGASRARVKPTGPDVLPFPGREPFAMLPHRIGCDPSIPPVDKAVLLVLVEWARDRPTCHPCNRSIGLRVGRGIRTIHRSLARLEARGLVAREAVEASPANPTGRVLTLPWNRAGTPPVTGDTPPLSLVTPPPLSSMTPKAALEERERKTREAVGPWGPPREHEEADAPVTHAALLAMGGIMARLARANPPRMPEEGPTGAGP